MLIPHCQTPRKSVAANGCDVPIFQTFNTMANAGLGVPIKLLHESLGHIITVELKTGQLYRGKLAEGAVDYSI